ncbi:MAG: hypothetical protein LBR95_02700 [Azoarcus sp.]|jgi:hypothetical protein|nr:hypothetical protein [Azoarcus sp.]
MIGFAEARADFKSLTFSIFGAFEMDGKNQWVVPINGGDQWGVRLAGGARRTPGNPAWRADSAKENAQPRTVWRL